MSTLHLPRSFPGGSASKESICNAGDPSSISGLGRSSGEGIGFSGGSDGKESACNERDLGSIPGLGRSPRGGHGNPLQCSCLENPVDRAAQQAVVHGVAKSGTRLNDEQFHSPLEQGSPSSRI